MQKKRCSRKIMDLMNDLTFIMRQKISAINVMVINLQLQIRLINKFKTQAYLKIIKDKLIDMFSTPTPTTTVL